MVSMAMKVGAWSATPSFFGAGQEEAGVGVFFEHAVFLAEQHDDRDVEAAGFSYGGLCFAVGAAVQEHDEDVAVFKLEQLFSKCDAGGVERIGMDARAWNSLAA